MTVTTRLFAAYDWELPDDDYVSLAQSNASSGLYKEEMSDIIEIDCGFICVSCNDDVKFAFEPLSLIPFIRWAVQNHRYVLSSRVILVNAMEEYVLIDCSERQLTFHAIRGIGTEDWRQYLGWQSMPTSPACDITATKASSKEERSLPGVIDRSMTISRQVWLEGVLEIGEEFRRLLVESRPLIDANPANWQHTDEADSVSEAYEFCAEQPALRREIERELRNCRN